MTHDSHDALMDVDDTAYSLTASSAVELGNRTADENPDADVRAVADGLLAGAVHYWFYANQPCEDPACEECMRMAESRLAMLQELVAEAARQSEYYHSPMDANAGHA